MMRPQRDRRPTDPAPARRLAVAALVTIAAIALWSGCSVNKSNYKVLSFFFDGVPDPSLPVGALGGSADGKPVLVVLHPPYVQERCDECHKSKYRPTKNDSSICLPCHAAVQTQYPRMHGPVVATACLWCHNPHESSQPALLRFPDRKVCSQCHTESMLESARVPAHADPKRGCVECHSGHGSVQPFMLKPGVTPGAPRTPGAEPEKN